MSDAMLRKILREKVTRLGLPWLKAVLDHAGVTRISDLTRSALLAAIEERA
jgi:hypothetical protein